MLNGKPIDRLSVTMRFNPLGWPAGADADDPLYRFHHDAAIDAQRVFDTFERLSATNAQNEGLTEIGRRQAAHEWSEKHLPELREKLAKVRERVAETTEGAMKTMTSGITAPAEKPHDIALLQEVRDWLRGLPENERSSKVFDLARKGDRTILRAVLNGPSYLTGVTEGQLFDIRAIVAEADHPERFAKLQLVQRAAEYAELACDRVIRYVEQESTVLGRVPGASKPKTAA